MPNDPLRILFPLPIPVMLFGSFAETSSILLKENFSIMKKCWDATKELAGLFFRMVTLPFFV